MKTIFNISFLLLMTVSTNAQDFKTDFQKLFSQSIKGLEGLKGAPVDGGWACDEKLEGYEASMVSKDEDLGVLVLVFSNSYTSEDEAIKSLETKESNIAEALPPGQYNKSKTYDTDYFTAMKTIFEFNSSKMADLQKRPSVEMGIRVSGSRYMVTMILIEPYFKNQYTPGF